MRYTTIGSDPLSARKVSLLSLGAMRFGTTTDAATSFAILDRYVAAGGNFIDTSNNYLFSVNKTQGGESEALLGRWRASRGIGAEIVIATKVGRGPPRRRPTSAPRAKACPGSRAAALGVAQRRRLIQYGSIRQRGGSASKEASRVGICLARWFRSPLGPRAELKAHRYA
jgi:aryl-alcohol dehydrogenase-like predicted oxidoreductase